MQTPHTFYKWARTAQPIFFDEASGYWVLTKYDDVKKVLRNEAYFSAELERVNYEEICPHARAILEPINFQELYGLSTTENPNHDKVKAVLMPILHELFYKTLKPQVENLIYHEVLRLKGMKVVNIAKELFYHLPAEIVFTILGVPSQDIPKIKEWTKSRMVLTWGPAREQTSHAANIVRYWKYTQELLRSKAKHPGNDLPSKLIEAEKAGQLTRLDIELLCYGLIFSGHTTTSTFLTESLKTMLYTDVWSQIIEEDYPFIYTVDELLRLCPSAFTRRRIVKKDFTVRDHTFTKGSKLLLVIGSANRDEEVFAAPDELILARPNSNKHLTLGSGFHYCIGAKIVKLEYATVMRCLADVFPDMILSGRNTFEYESNISIRALRSLYVNLY
ncbi:MAG: cytochrome P450 [Bacteroidota bacterium]